MKSIMTWGVALCALGISASSYAQERTAAGATETQMSWSSLATKINTISTKADAVNTRVDQVVICARKGMLYTPAASGADAQGCREASQGNNIGTNITSIVNTLNATNSSLGGVSNNVNNILNCNRVGQVFNGSGCVLASANPPNCRLESWSQQDSMNCSGRPGGQYMSTSYSSGGNDSPKSYSVCARVICQ